jgi:hypothetical protein
LCCCPPPERICCKKRVREPCVAVLRTNSHSGYRIHDRAPPGFRPAWCRQPRIIPRGRSTLLRLDGQTLLMQLGYVPENELTSPIVKQWRDAPLGAGAQGARPLIWRGLDNRGSRFRSRVCRGCTGGVPTQHREVVRIWPRVQTQTEAAAQVSVIAHWTPYL